MTNHHPDSSLVAYVSLSLSHMGAGEAIKDASGDTSSSRCSVSSAPVPRDGVLSSSRRLVAATDTKPVVKNNPPPQSSSSSSSSPPQQRLKLRLLNNPPSPPPRLLLHGEMTRGDLVCWRVPTLLPLFETVTQHRAYSHPDGSLHSYVKYVVRLQLLVPSLLLIVREREMHMHLLVSLSLSLSLSLPLHCCLCPSALCFHWHSSAHV